MKRITLPDFTWIREPIFSKRDRLHVEVVVSGTTAPPPHAPLLVAVSDEYFDCELTVRSEGGCEAGLVLYHTDGTFIAIGLSGEELFITASVMGWSNRWRVKAIVASSERIIWSMARGCEGVSIGYRLDAGDEPEWLGCFTLPGTANSVSFGPYFSNPGENEAKAVVEAFSYRRRA